MRRITALALSALILGALAACAVKSAGPPADSPVISGVTLTLSEYKDTDFDTSGGLAVATEHEIYGADAPEITYLVTNNTLEEYVYGVQYAVEILIEGRWYRIPFPENTAWIDIGIILKPEGTNAGSFRLSELDFDFTEGQYRLIKEIGGKRYTAPFRIGDSPITAETPYGYPAPDTLPAKYSSDEAVKNGDVVILHNDVKNVGKLTEFIQKTALGVPAMLRITQYTVEGDAVITDCIYNENGRGYFEFRYDNTRDTFGGSTGITEAIYAYIITNGTDIYLSCCADWALLDTYTNADTVLLAWSSSFGDLSEGVALVRQMTKDRLEWNQTHCKVYSPDGSRNVALTSHPLSYIDEGPESSRTQTITDPNGTALRITNMIWLYNNAFVLVCQTSDSGRYYYQVIGDPDLKSGYGTDYTLTDDRFEIVP